MEHKREDEEEDEDGEGKPCQTENLQQSTGFLFSLFVCVCVRCVGRKGKCPAGFRLCTTFNIMIALLL